MKSKKGTNKKWKTSKVQRKGMTAMQQNYQYDSFVIFHTRMIRG